MKWKVKKIFVANCKWGSDILINDEWEPFGVIHDRDGCWIWLRKIYVDQSASPALGSLDDKG